MKKSNVTIGIVTYNRKTYLLKELDAIFDGTVLPEKLVIVDNCSTDGTADIFDIDNETYNVIQKTKYKSTDLFYFRSGKNKGGSFGFKMVFDLFLKNCDSRYLWVMDDDVMPEKDCLEILLKNVSEENGVVCPTRFGENFNETFITKYKFKNIVGIKQKHRVIKSTYNKDSEDTFVVFFPFEGPFFDRSVIEKVGLPDDSYFFQYDDGDYSYRCSQVTKIKYIVSAVLKRQIPVPLSSKFNESKFYYTLRNQIVFNKRYCKRGVYRTRLFFAFNYYLFGNLLRLRFKRIKLCLKAFYDGIHNRLGPFND